MTEHCACPTHTERSAATLIAPPTSHTTAAGWPRTSPGPGPAASAVVRHAPQQLLDRHAHLEPRQVRADAAVRADAERHVASVAPVEVELVGLGEDVAVAVGGAEQEQDALAGRDALPGDLRIPVAVRARAVTGE